MRRAFSGMFIGLALVATPVHAGMFDVISNGLGGLKDKIASNASGDSKPVAPCQAELKTACDALATSNQNSCEFQLSSEITAKHKQDVPAGLMAIAHFGVEDMAVEAKQDFSGYSAEKKAWQRAKYAYYVCAAKAYDADIEIMKSFKPVIPTVKAEKLEALPNTKKIILSNFVVEFQQRYESRSSGFSLMGLGNAGSSTAIHDVTLPDQRTLQSITNFAYQDVVKKLKARGYEVIEVSNLSEKSKPVYEKLKKTAPIKPGEVYSNIDGESVLVSPDGMTSSLPNAGCTHYGSRSALTNTGNNFRMSSSGYQTEYENEIANGEGKIPLLKVWIAIEFGEAKAKGGNAFISARQNNFLGTTKTTVSNSANADATVGMFLKPEVTRFAIELPVQTDYKNNHGCGISFGSALVPPADGDAFIRLAEKYHDDGDSAPLKMSSQAGTVGITDTHIGGGVGIRRVGDNNDGSQDMTVDTGRGTKTTQKAVRTSGIVDTNEGFGDRTSLHSVSEWATEIRSDVYAASAATMIYKVTDAFVSKLP